MPLDGRSKRWWIDTTKDVANTVCEIARTLRDKDDRRLRQWRNLYLYGEAGDNEILDAGHERYYPTYNVIREAVDAMHARISKAKPRAWVVTQGGSHELQDRSKLLTTWLDGEFERLNTYGCTNSALHDCCVYGAGAIKHIVGSDGRPAQELAYVGHLFVDPREERLRCVRTLYQVCSVDREALMERFSDKDEEIKKATDDSKPDPDDIQDDSAADLLTVYEAWRLGTGDQPGRHVVAIEGVTLVNEEWPAGEWFPFAFLHYSRDPRRFWGVGLPERMCGGQSDLNELCSRITESYKVWVQRIYLMANSGLSVDEFTDEIGSVHQLEGGPETVPAIPPVQAIGRDFTDREQWRAMQMLQSEGISPMSSRMDKPAGLNSGKALIVHQDVESERHIVLSRSFEKLHIDCAKRLISLAEQIVKSDEDQAKKLRAMGGKRILEVVTYDKARMESDQYRVRVKPASSLSTSPAGKIQEVQNLVDMQVIQDPDEVRELLDFPDLDSYNDLESAGRNVARRLIEEAAKGKRVVAIEEIPLDYAIKRARQQVCIADLEGQPEGRMSTLRDLLGQLTSIKDRQLKAQQAAQMAAQQPGPPAGPQPAGAIPAPAV